MEHLNHIVQEFTIYNHQERSHQSRGNVPLSNAMANETKSGAVVAKPAETKPTADS
ncbi:MAG: hypothetical protein U0792_12670 [Gemmataceae bacterium]